MGRWSDVDTPGWTGERVKRLRIALGLTRAKLGARLGVHQFSIGRWERGQALPSPEAMSRLDVLLLEELTGGKPRGDDLGDDLPFDEEDETNDDEE